MSHHSLNHTFGACYINTQFILYTCSFLLSLLAVFISSLMLKLKIHNKKAGKNSLRFEAIQPSVNNPAAVQRVTICRTLPSWLRLEQKKSESCAFAET